MFLVQRPALVDLLLTDHVESRDFGSAYFSSEEVFFQLDLITCNKATGRWIPMQWLDLEVSPAVGCVQNPHFLILIASNLLKGYSH